MRVDKDSGIKNDPNDWAAEHGKPRYILDLLLSIVTVSLETMKIVKSLPSLTFAEQTTTTTVESEDAAISTSDEQDFPHQGREAVIRKILPYILQAHPGLSREKAFQRAWLVTYPDACVTLLAEKASAFKDAFAKSELGRWTFAQDDPVRERELWDSWQNNLGISMNANGECSLVGNIQFPIQGAEAIIPFILEAAINYDLGVEQLLKQKRFQNIPKLQECFTLLAEERKNVAA